MLLLADRGGRLSHVVVARVHHRGIGQGFETTERVVEIGGASTHEVGAAGAAREQRVAGEQVTVDQDRERVGSVPGRVEDADGARPELERRAARHALDRPRELRRGVRHDRGARSPGQHAHTGQVVGMGVRIEDVREADAAGRERLLERADLVQARIDRQGGAARLIHDEIAETAFARGTEGFDRERRGTGQGRHVASLLAMLI